MRKRYLQEALRLLIKELFQQKHALKQALINIIFTQGYVLVKELQEL